MQVRDAMTRAVIAVHPGTSVMNARRLLHAHGIRHLPVVDERKVVGMVSDRDVRISDRELVDSLARLQSDLLTGRYRQVRAVMSTPVHTVHGNETVAQAARIMLDHRIGALPVVAGGELTGILSLVDCVEALLAAAADGPGSPTLDADAPLPLGIGDERPGRPPRQPLAVVVDPDDARRLARVTSARRAGYRVVSCPGPLGGTLCTGVGGSGSGRCGRVPADVDLVVMDDRTATTKLPEAYRIWAPRAQMRIEPTADEGEGDDVSVTLPAPVPSRRTR